MTKSFDYFRVKSWQEAVKILDSLGDKAAILAGGTDLLPAMKLNLRRPEVLIDLNGIARSGDLAAHLPNNSEVVVLSPLTKLSQLGNNPFIQKRYPALTLAASKVGSPQLRNMATLGGNICLNTRCIYYNQSEQWRKTRPACFKMAGNVCHVQRKGKNCLAEFQADTVPVLMALKADLKIISAKGEHVIPISNFYSGSGNPPNLLGPSELIAEIRLSQPAEGYRATFEKFAVREGIDFATVCLSAFLRINPDDRKCQEARIVVSGALPSPFICRQAASMLQDHELDDERIKLAAREAAREAKPINPTGFSVPYKRHLIEVLTARALQKILN